MAASAGGIARHVAYLVEALDAREGFEVDLAGVRPPMSLPKPLIEVAIPGGVFGHRAAQSRLRAVVADGGYDVVHAHGLRAAVDAALAVDRQVPVVATVHNLVRPDVAGRLRAPVYARAEGMTVRLCHRVLAVSDDIAVHLRRRSPAHAGKVETLYLGLGEIPKPERSADEVRAEIDAHRAPLVVTASRLAPQKALHVLLHAVAELEGDVVLAVAGTGPSEEGLKRLARDLGVTERVRWLGFRRDVHSLIAAADVFCLSSTWEGVPLAAQEAMLLGTPVVATAVGGVPELVTDGESGRLVPPGDAHALAAALRDLLASDELRRTLAARAGHDVRSKFSSDRMLDHLSRAYRELARAT